MTARLMNIIVNHIRKAGLLMAALLMTAALFAQDRIVVKGVVSDENGQPLIGAGVMEKGTTNGAVTDIDGNYTLEVSADGVLTFSYISYKSQEMNVNGKAVINMQLFPDNTLLDEVVVIGYGTVKKSDLTGSVSSVSAKSIDDFKTSSVVEALGGQLAGVQITQSDGTPGSSFDIKIRGVGTVNGDSSPLIIVDGFEVSSLDFVSNQDIQSIDVLKDASAAAIYGARGANGVILVTTKQGREGKTQVSYNGSVNYREISKRMELLDPYDFVALQMEINPTKFANTYYQQGEDSDGIPYKYQSLEDYRNVAGIDWQEEAFRPTWSQTHDVRISGGNKTTKYTASFSHFDENGIFKNSGYMKNTARLSLNQELFKWLNMNVTVNYSNTRKDGIGTSESTGSLNVLANLLRARPTGGLKVSDEELLNSAFDPLAVESGDNTSANPIKQAETVSKTDAREQWSANGYLNFKIVKGLTFKTSASYSTTNRRLDTFYQDGSSQAFRSGGPYGETQMQKDTRWSNNNVLTYQNTFNKKHNLTAMLGHEISYFQTYYMIGQAKNFPFEGLGNDNLGLGATPSRVETGKSDEKLLSFFARVDYNYDDRYLFTATMRADGSTVFSRKNKWGYFPSFAASWRISEEPFMEGAKNWLSNLKLRAGYGLVGNDRITNYLSMNLYTDGKYGVGQNQVTVLTPKQLANPNLKWEASATTNVGLDLGFFDSRLNVTVDGFIKDTKDLLLEQDLAFVTGFEGQWQNIGKVRNQGVEISINSINFQNRNFSWTTNFNISFIKNTLEALQDGTDVLLRRTEFNSNFKQYDYIAIVGQSLGMMYGYQFDGVYQTSDFNVTPDGQMILKPGITDISDHMGEAVQPGMIKYKDMNGDRKITDEDLTVIGNGMPKWYGGITNTFNIYNVDLSFLLQFNYGNDVYNATRLFSTQTQDERTNQLAEVKDRWTPSHASNKVPSATGYKKYDIDSRYIEDGSFLRLKNITLGYTFPDKWTNKVHISRLRVYASAQNLFCLTNYSGYDPEVNMKNSPLMQSFDWGAYPKSRAFILGIEINFN